MNNQRRIAALYVREDSPYKAIDFVDCWTAARDARRWPGGTACIAHPPCAAWGKYYHKTTQATGALALLALDQVRNNGGVLEHPAHSQLFNLAVLPKPGEMPDAWGGWTLEINQVDFGHEATKATWLYVVGPATLRIAPGSERPSVIRPLEHLSHRQREITPPALARALAMLALQIDEARRTT